MKSILCKTQRKEKCCEACRANPLAPGFLTTPAFEVRCLQQPPATGSAEEAQYQHPTYNKLRFVSLDRLLGMVPSNELACKLLRERMNTIL